MAESHLILVISKKMMESCISPCCCILQPAMCKIKVVKTGSICMSLRKADDGERGRYATPHMLPSLPAPFQLWLSDTGSAVGLPGCSIWDALTVLITCQELFRLCNDF